MNDWLAHRAAVSPGTTAVVETEDGAEWTYADLDSAVEETAGRLAALGLRAGDHLGVLMETRFAAVRLVHAAMRLGCVLVPLNVRLARPELRRQVATADLAALVCERDTESDAAAISADVPVTSVDSMSDERTGGSENGGENETRGSALVERAPADFESATWNRGDPQVILFTSGTTGSPKAVVLTMGNLLASATASAFRLGVVPDDRWHLCLSTYHMGGIAPLLRSTLYGTTVVVQEGFEPDATLATMAEHGATGVSLVPTMLRRLLDAGELPDSLRFVLLGGAPARDDLIRDCAERDVPVCPTYGMTETASQVATARPDEAFSHVGTVGRPLLWTDVTVVDESGDPLPAGEPGELVVSGPTVMAGYYGNLDATDAAFGEFGLHTGDVGYRDDGGRLRLLNRRSDRIVTGGENVEPGEVVAVLREHPAIREVAVVGVPDSEWGERADDGEAPSSPSLADLREFCDDRLAGYKHPRLIATADELPRTASGTVDREAVADRLEAAR